MRLGLQAAALVFLAASAASWVAGYPPDIALLRGMIAGTAVGFGGFLIELLVATSPVRPRSEPAAQARVSVPASPRPLEGEVTAPDQYREDPTP
jgi:hypothetical protein